MSCSGPTTRSSGNVLEAKGHEVMESLEHLNSQKRRSWFGSADDAKIRKTSVDDYKNLTFEAQEFEKEVPRLVEAIYKFGDSFGKLITVMDKVERKYDKESQYYHFSSYVESLYGEIQQNVEKKHAEVTSWHCFTELLSREKVAVLKRLFPNESAWHILQWNVDNEREELLKETYHRALQEAYTGIGLNDDQWHYLTEFKQTRNGMAHQSLPRTKADAHKDQKILKSSLLNDKYLGPLAFLVDRHYKRLKK
jgi:hypothetical protein